MNYNDCAELCIPFTTWRTQNDIWTVQSVTSGITGTGTTFIGALVDCARIILRTQTLGLQQESGTDETLLAN